LPDAKEHTNFLPKPWVYHTLFWIAYYVFAALISLSVHHITDPRFYLQLATLVPPDMALVYWHLFLLRHFLLRRRKIALYVLLLLPCIAANAFVNISLHRLYTQWGSPFFAGSDTYDSQNFAGHVLNSIYLLGLATAAKFVKDWVLQKQQLQEIEKTQIKTELAFLRAQIQPHFFFNTLNNLYSLTLQKSDRAPEVVLKLSSLMSYMLYESAAPLAPLQHEIATLEDYLSLEQLRFGSRLILSFEKETGPTAGPEPYPEPAAPTASVRIPPLILLSFVENAFKHGMSQLPGEGRIDIHLSLQPDTLLFRISNPVAPNRNRPSTKADPVAQAEPGDQPANGIGLRNVIRRLDLLYGPRYDLDLRETDNTFHVTLKIPLP
jgi:two-component system LytT family sensor kinase